MPYMPEVESSWKEGEKAVKVRVRNFDLIIDHPIEQKGTDLGPTPSEALLVALAGCFTGTLVPIARAMGISIESVSLRASAVKGEKEYESLRSIDIWVRTVPEIKDRDRFRRLLEQTKRNCTISNTLAHSPILTFHENDSRA